MTLILFVLIFGVVVVSHEFGHFLLAKMNGIHVIEFSVGMGPRICSFDKGDTKYSLKLFPIGGACMFEGEDGMNVKEGEISEGSFLNANVWARISTVIAGPIFNFILGTIIAIIMVNMIQINLPHIVRIVDEGAAYDAGLQEGDQIISLNGEKIYLYEELLLFNRINGSNPVEMKFKRGDQILVTTLTPKLNEETGGYLLGIGCGGTAEETGLGRLKYAWYEMRFCVKQTYKSLGLLVQGKVKSDELAGPVGIAVNVVGKTYDAAKEIGWSTVLVNMLNITLLLSINLGILNLLPLPALDGGRLVFLVIEVIRGKPVPPEKEGMVHFVGLMFFMGLMIFVMFNDIKNIFG